MLENTYHEQMQVQVLLLGITSCLKLFFRKATEQYLLDRQLYILFWDVAVNTAPDGADLYIASDNLWLGPSWPVKIDAI